MMGFRVVLIALLLASTTAVAQNPTYQMTTCADAVMLSAESATGSYPCEAVEMMDRIIRSTEQHKFCRSIIEASQPNEEQTAPHAVASAAADLAEAIHAPAIVAFTSSGTTAARIARKRPAVPILAITPNEMVARRLSLLWSQPSFGKCSHLQRNVLLSAPCRSQMAPISIGSS
jgi:pyruvate kinase